MNWQEAALWTLGSSLLDVLCLTLVLHLFLKPIRRAIVRQIVGSAVGEPTAPNTDLGKPTVPELVEVARQAQSHPEFLRLRDKAMQWGWQPHDAERLAARACCMGGTDEDLAEVCGQ